MMERVGYKYFRHILVELIIINGWLLIITNLSKIQLLEYFMCWKTFSICINILMLLNRSYLIMKEVILLHLMQLSMKKFKMFHFPHLICFLERTTLPWTITSLPLDILFLSIFFFLITFSLIKIQILFINNILQYYIKFYL